MPRLYPYQRRGVRRIERFEGRALLADEMGLGKTAQALWWCKSFLFPKFKKKRCVVIVVCPASIKINWHRECLLHINTPAEVLSSKKARPIKLTRKHNILIINYDVLKDWVHHLQQLDPDVIIGDECHYIKSPRAKRTKAFQMLCDNVNHVIGMSGTPATNKPIELFPILNIVRPDIFDSMWKFGKRYCKWKMTPWGPKFDGAQRLDELHDLLRSTCMIRRKKSQVLKDLPAKRQIVVPVELSSRQEYDMAEKKFIQWMIKTHPQKAEKARRAERMVKIGYLLRLVASLKMTSIKEWISNYLEETDEKLLVFGKHRKILIPLSEHFEGISVRVDGKITKQKRQDNFDAFNRNKRIKLLFGNIQAAGVGWSCYSTSVGLFVEFPWTPGELSQAGDRLHGVGRGIKGKVTTLYYLIGRGTIEEWLCGLLQKKQKTLDQMFDGKEQEDSIRIADQLEEILIQGFKEKGRKK
jgi:SWI/SNF-related matrix-associated actin-dependent regulator 1 of chromatin subfamily A